MKIALLVFAILISPYHLQAEEMDHFSDRLFMIKHLKEANQVEGDPLNSRVNQLLKEMVMRLNQSPPQNFKDKRSEIIRAFLHPLANLRDLVTPYANWVVSDAPVPVFYPTHRGIFGWDVNFSNVLMAWYVKLVPILKLNGVLQGSDKIGHFFGQGWMYYEHYLELQSARDAGQPDEAALDEKVRLFGHETEMGNLGFGTGGVYSHADLASNWQGFRFFQELFDGNGARRYIIQKGDAYALQRQFNWGDYVTDDWDEVINPSRLKDQASFDKVKANFHRKGPSGKSICQEYLANKSKFMNQSGKGLLPSQYRWKGVNYSNQKYFLRIRTLCQSAS